MPVSISGVNSATNGATLQTVVSSQTWRALHTSDGTSISLGINNWGSMGRGNTSGITLIIAGIDPVIEFLLTVRLRTTGQIWPIGFSR